MKKIVNLLLITVLISALCACSSSNGKKETELELVTTLDQTILTLSTGKCDAIALDGTTAENYVASSNGQFALTGGQFRPVDLRRLWRKCRSRQKR